MIFLLTAKYEDKVLIWAKFIHKLYPLSTALSCLNKVENVLFLSWASEQGSICRSFRFVFFANFAMI